MKPIHIFLAVLVCAIWGVNFVVIKVGLENFPPLLFSCLRFLLSAFPAIFFIKRPKVNFMYVIAAGIILGTIKFSLLFEGISYGMSAGLSSLVLQMQVFFSILGASFIFHEKIKLLQMVGIILGFIGLMLVMFQVDTSTTVAGLAFTLGAALAWSCNNLLMRKMGKANMLSFMVWMSLIPIIPMFLLSWKIEGLTTIITAIKDINSIGWFALIYVSFLATIFGYGVWGWLLTKFPVGLVAPFALLIPLFGMLASFLFFHEHFSTQKIIATILILFGLMLNSFGDKFIKKLRCLAS